MKITKIFLSWILFFFVFAFVQAQEYVYFYWNWCSHCAKVEKFFEKNDIYEKFSIENKEVYFNRDNLADFQIYAKKLNLSVNDLWVPFLVINSWVDCSYLKGEENIVNYFQNKITETCSNPTCSHDDCWPTCTHLNCEKIESQSGSVLSNEIKSRFSFFGVMLPAALSDSINPCEFAVMLLLLSWILVKTKNRRKAIWSWLLFSLAVFISYFWMWMWLFTALASSQNTYILKMVVWIIWILVWLANLKDFFWYGKWFVMEVPFSWRPTLQKVVNKATSPLWAFIVWIVVSFFLLPCTSWPYLTILWYLASESKQLHFWWYLYLIVYNIVFILPMLVIALLVWLGIKSPEELAKIKKKNTKLIHLIVWLLMLGLWLYVLLTM